MKLSKIEEIVLAIVIIVVIGLSPSIATLFKTITIPNYCAIKAVGVAFYWNSAATQPVSNITWGLVDPGASYSTLVYCENVKNSNITMTLIVWNWNPTTASDYISSGWNYTGAVLRPGAIVPILFQLQVYSNVTGITNFSFDSNVTAAAQ
jgi:hypothetical protein